MAIPVIAGRYYPIADSELTPAQRRTHRVRATLDTRLPRKGEWYLSGAIPEGYRAPSDLSIEYRIGTLVYGVSAWTPTQDLPSGRPHFGDREE